jgi:serine/threonine protein kinase
VKTLYVAVIAGPDKGHVFQVIAGAPMLVGRSRHSDTQFTDLRISRVHCEIEWDDEIWITDHGGSGTYVNGQRVQEHQLKLGDVIQIGDTQLRLQETAKAEEATVNRAAAEKVRVQTPETMHELKGARLSHYIVGDVLAKGQTGVVFLARDVKDDAQRAFKVMFPQATGSSRELRRFVRSVKTMLPLRHPNLVTLHGAGKSGPYCFVAMDFIAGESLAQVIQRIGVAGMLDWKSAYRVAVHIASALEYVHGKQIVHRNITPQNVLMRVADKITLLGDWMLAKALEGQHAEQITKPGEILGDLGYMSPERTVSQNIDGRSDLYALGALVYALLTGRPPCGGANLVERIKSIRTDVPARPRQFQMSIPDAFENVVMKLLEKQPEKRYGTATELLAELTRLGKLQGVQT